MVYMSSCRDPHWMSTKFFVIICAQIKKLQDLGFIYIYIYIIYILYILYIYVYVTNMNNIRNFVIYIFLINYELKIPAIVEVDSGALHIMLKIYFSLSNILFSVLLI
jgi:hypothetical protein